LSIRETAERIRDVVGYRGELVFDATKPDGMPLKSLESNRLIQLGWRSRTSIVAALNKTYDAYLQRECTQEPVHA
jgi:GDP-L-fucose synthase